jgi:hypothetical protein
VHTEDKQNRDGWQQLSLHLKSSSSLESVLILPAGYLPAGGLKIWNGLFETRLGNDNQPKSKNGWIMDADTAT